MHRVVNMTSVGIDPGVIEGYKEEIRQKLVENGHHEAQVNDGQNEAGEPTLAVSVDFSSATAANAFHNWLKVYVADRREQFKSARTRVHDCYHAADLNMPCELGDVWELV